MRSEVVMADRVACDRVPPSFWPAVEKGVDFVPVRVLCLEDMSLPVEDELFALERRQAGSRKKGVGFGGGLGVCHPKKVHEQLGLHFSV